MEEFSTSSSCSSASFDPQDYLQDDDDDDEDDEDGEEASVLINAITVFGNNQESDDDDDKDDSLTNRPRQDYPFVFSAEPSTFLRRVGLEKKANDFLKRNLQYPVKFLALCRSRIGTLTKLFGAYHEYIVLSVGGNVSFGKGFFGRRECREVECLVIEFSRYSQDKSRSVSMGVINLTCFNFNVDVKRDQTIQGAFLRKAKSKGIEMVECHTEDESILLSDVLMMAGILATPGYDLVNNNCRHFAKSLYWSCRLGEGHLADDKEQRTLRRIAKWIDRKGCAGSNACMVSLAGSISATIPLVLEAAFAASTGGASMAVTLMNKIGSADLFFDLFPQLVKAKNTPFKKYFR